MINRYLFDEEFIVKTLDIILNPGGIESVQYHNKILFKVSNFVDVIYDYEDSHEVVSLINNIYGMSGKKPQKGIFEIKTKSGIKFFLDVSKDSLTLGKSIEIKNKVKFIIGIVVLVILNYIFSILVNI